MRRILLGASVAMLLTVACSSTSSSSTAPTAPAVAPTQSTAGESVNIALADFSITSNVSTIAPGTVTFDISNSGPSEHEFVILKTNVAPDALPVKDGEASEKGHVDELEGVQSGQTGTLSVDLTPGTYVFVCNLPGHYQLGMHEGFSVG